MQIFFDRRLFEQDDTWGGSENKRRDVVDEKTTKDKKYLFLHIPIQHIKPITHTKTCEEPNFSMSYTLKLRC